MTRKLLLLCMLLALAGSVAAHPNRGTVVEAPDPTLPAAAAPVDHVKNIDVVATVLGGKFFPVNYTRAH